MDFLIPEEIKKICTSLQSAGFEACLVGGCLRDLLLQKEPHDWDITTSALPKQAEEVLSKEFYCRETGIQHGTITVFADNISAEVTTYRIDGNYSDHRRPDTVLFTRNLTEDLKRRDFTINAMAWDGTLTDPFGGQKDLSAKTIRCVGNPDDRFQEDGLRILRALRFASTLDFFIEPKTAQSIHQNRWLLKSIAMERICSELLRLICGEGAARILDEYQDVFFVFLPELLPETKCPQNNPYHIYDVWHHTLKALENVPPTPDRRLATLLHDIGKPSCHTTDKNGIDHFHGHGKAGVSLSQAILRRLRCPKKFSDLIVSAVHYHDILYTDDEHLIRRRLQKLGKTLFFLILDLKRGDTAGQNPLYFSRLEELNRIETHAQKIIAEGNCFSLKQLAVNGNDLLKAGVSPGPQMGKILRFLLEAVMNGQCANTKSELIQYYQTNFFEDDTL
ncbi:MAG: HD domain-containing protein [Clostridiales bacterium]|jgi:tRNA nucleotidyltransferase (CCA-adding enzyme)|nr:HD domain-containing protein [Clostridiales bacterium]MCI2162055.1 HD domain-containing protein [Oscillospiraceae bacterium]MCI1962041.1 HD domain-containing protein [Clostridiales bacterium]MCI2022226.1 HD domain-containing protein [Clostridiales bacterium]MCI2026623.1 HD domain-containing protein [Clostridiales bacterium]